MSPRARLLTEQRRRNLLDLIDQDGQVTVAEMVKQFAISAVTARSDLDALASIGAVVRSHGGAVRRLVATQDYPLRTKETLHRSEKVRIGRAAAEMVKPGETIILDSGTTTAEVARHLKKLNLASLTVITNALNIAVELMECPGISLIMIGGLLRPVSCSFVGPLLGGAAWDATGAPAAAFLALAAGAALMAGLAAAMPLRPASERGAAHLGG